MKNILIQAKTFYLVAGVEAIGHGVLVDVEGGQPQGELVLELGGEPLLSHVVGALHVEILERHRVGPQQLVRVGRDEGDAEQAAEVVRSWPRGDLGTNGILFNFGEIIVNWE